MNDAWIKFGSTRHVYVYQNADGISGGPGWAIFRTTDDYSVADAKKMSDTIPLWGAARNMFSAYVFEELRKLGVKTHYMGVIDKDGRPKNVHELKEPSEHMRISWFNIISVTYGLNGYDYSGYKNPMNGFLLPLELIVRNKLPKGSSIFGRLERGEITYQELGLDHYPVEGERLPKPFLDLTTKLERTDRPLKWPQAKELANLTDVQVEDVRFTMAQVNVVLKDICERIGFELADFKSEFGSFNDRIYVLDNHDPDGCRMEHKATGVSFSKQPARDYFKKTEWGKSLDAAKKRAEAEHIEDFMQFCAPAPLLDPELRTILSQMYASITNAALEKRFFDVSPVDQVAENFLAWNAKHQ